MRRHIRTGRVAFPDPPQGGPAAPARPLGGTDRRRGPGSLRGTAVAALRRMRVSARSRGHFRFKLLTRLRFAEIRPVSVGRRGSRYIYPLFSSFPFSREGKPSTPSAHEGGRWCPLDRERTSSRGRTPGGITCRARGAPHRWWRRRAPSRGRSLPSGSWPSSRPCG
jgi:hypothetical protein